MTKKMQDAVEKRASLLAELESLIDSKDGKFEEVEKAYKNMCAYIESLEKLEEKEKEQVIGNKTVTENRISGFSILARAIKSAVFTDEVGSPLKTGGLNGEDYLLPEDVKLEINKYKQELVSAKELVTVVPTFALSGSFNWGRNPDSGLVAFDDGDELDSSKLPEFAKEQWSVEWYGAIIPVSSILEGAEQAGLMPFIDYWFTRRAVKTENTAIFDAFKANYNSGTPKELANEKALRKSINTEIDPSFAKGGNMVIVTNQNGFNYLDQLQDTNGRDLLQPDPTQPTQKLYKGIPVKVYSNAQLPDVSSGTKVPVIYGATKDALWFMEYQNYYFDTDNGKGLGFAKNTTLLKVMEGFALCKADTSAYIYGSLTIGA